MSSGFTTTDWGELRAASAGEGGDASLALEGLCRNYWYPLYAYVRRQGYSAADAEDLTQEFFARFLARRYYQRADPSRGRFRTFLLTSLKRFLITEADKAGARKRGGGMSLVSLNETTAAETRYACEPADPGAQPDELYDRQWALTMLGEVLAELEEEFAAHHCPEHFGLLKAFIWGDKGTALQTQIAAQLGMTPNSVGVTVHRLRRRFGQLLREAVLRTVAKEDEVDAELHHLVVVMNAESNPGATSNSVRSGLDFQ
jgi:RNA polymerase sigma-70 factor (ECF subfamily)